MTSPDSRNQREIHLSIVSPIYHAEEIVEELVRRIVHAVGPLGKTFEIILVEDGGLDHSWEKIREQSERYPSLIRGIRLSRNFGQHAAITAALEHARGQWVIVMDCDLQDDPQYIPQMLETALSARVDIVFTKKQKVAHPPFKKLIGQVYHRAFNWLVGTPHLRGSEKIGSFSLLNRKVVDAFLRIHDHHRHYLGLVRWLGFRSTCIEILHHQRFSGESSYSFSKLFSHALIGITSQSNRILYFSVVAGLATSGLSLAWGTWLFITYLFSGAREGWELASVLMLLCTGVILSAIGTVGIYIGNIFDQSRNRPLYVADEFVNL